jgi:uncharacterized membrane-anchored protein
MTRGYNAHANSAEEEIVRQMFVGFVFACVAGIGSLFAQDAAPFSETPELIQAKLGMKKGNVELPGGIATIRVPENLRFMGEEGSRRLLTEIWGNPPESAEDVLGMIVPSDFDPRAKESWGVVITFEEDGYVNDDDAGSIDFTKLLAEMREGVTAANEERKEAGFPTVTLVGWAEPPHYDSATHKLYWAKELVFSDSDDHTLNYSIRILGRRGVLVLNAVGGMDQLSLIHEQTPSILTAVDFNEGHRYSDYLPGEKTATYGLTGLIVGAAAAKAGFFKVLWLGILAFKKFVILGIVAVAGVVKKLWDRRRAVTSEPPVAG